LQKLDVAESPKIINPERKLINIIITTSFLSKKNAEVA
jgi:hypothetical protein